MNRRYAGDPLRLVIVDALPLIEPESKYEPEPEQIHQITRDLKALAVELALPIVCTVPMSRWNGPTMAMRPRLSDLRACGPIEPYADLIIFPHRPDHDAPIRRREKTVFAELIVAKNRSGPLGIAETCWNTAIAQFDG